MGRLLRSAVSALSLVGLASCSPPVKVSLRTSWNGVPVLLEVLEAVSTERPDAFFPLLDAFSKASPSPQKLTPEAAHEFALQTAVSLGYLKEPGSLASAQLQVALHANAPKVQAFYQFYEDQHFESRVGCESWVDWYGERVCDVDTLLHLAGHDTIDSSANKASNISFSRPQLLSFDHINPPPARAIEPPPRTAVLYADVESSNFAELHNYLHGLSNAPNPRLEYVVRYAPPSTGLPAGKVHLSGYGVSLDLKKTDYLAVDDRRTTTSPESVDGDSSQNPSVVLEDTIHALIESYPESSIQNVNTPLTKEEFQQLGAQSTQLIVDSEDPLITLKQLSQNFPRYASPIARRVVVNESLLAAYQENMMKVQGGLNLAWLNGLNIAEGEINPLSLLRLMRRERNVIKSLVDLGMSTSEAVDVVAHRIISTAQSDNGVLDGMFDSRDIQEGGNVIIWWNDFQKDSRYASWNPSLSMLLRPLFPGQFHNVKQNLFNVVLVVDLSEMESIKFISGAVSNIIARGFPFRFGVVPAVETQDGQKMARLFYYLIDNVGRAKTMGFLTKLQQVHTSTPLLGTSVDWDLVQTELKSLMEANASEDDEEPVPAFSSILEGTTDDKRIEGCERYALRLDTDLHSSPTGHAFFNGKHFNLDEDFLRSMQQEHMAQLQHLQEKVYLGELGDHTEQEAIDDYFPTLPTTASSRNHFVIPPTPDQLKIANLPELFARNGFQVPHTSFLYPDTDVVPLTLLVIADLDTEAGLAFVKEALTSMRPGSPSRISFVHNPSLAKPQKDDRNGRMSRLLSHLIFKRVLSKLTASQFDEVVQWYLGSIIRGDGYQDIFASDSPIHNMLDGDLLVHGALDGESHDQFCLTSQLLVRDLGLQPGDLGVVANGRIVGPIDPYKFKAEAFAALEEYELSRRVAPVHEAIKSVTLAHETLDRATFSHLIMTTSSIISSIQSPDASEQGLFNTKRRPRQMNYRLLDRNHTGFEYGDRAKATYHFGFLLDPIGEAAQKWSVLIEWLSSDPSVYVEVYLHPGMHSELPIKRFYRYNLSPQLAFDENGAERAIQTVFDSLPVDPIYTLAMDVPPAWLVRPRQATYDLDNIQLSVLPPSEQKTGVEAIFELDFIVIEGHARDAVIGSPPRGLQLQLTGLDDDIIDDTQVVANLGYFQFKATPGVFRLEIRDGRGRDVFQMESVGNEGWDSPNITKVGNVVSLTSFEGWTLFPRVRRIPGMETADVLDEFVFVEEKPQGFFEGLKFQVVSFFQKKKPDDTKQLSTSRQAEINIFTVASGLLYERFASIMILSVLKNTKSTVKFWFIENFLSPSFLEFIPHFAEAYGFQYELVTYKWPSWLRAQKEKQRIIWAYKILFLDVLFPMDLKKVIFVDADQIVRADLKELVDLNLHGAPYGYTPMGDDNYDMEGFRFWKTGYWKESLHGRPYHISALYVVDLVRFRQLAAGDILRGQYQQLSGDPHSLANLDQDLPNSLQFEVPIFSLHEDWLWCETWCSKDRLDRAKTIDLCQNPLTKEPKLSRARQIPEWEEYDSEIAKFARELADKGLIKSHMAAADSNVLANAASGSPTGEGEDPPSPGSGGVVEPETTCESGECTSSGEGRHEEL